MNHDRLTELLAGWEEDGLSPTEMDALADCLERDPDARAQAVQHFTFSGDIARALRSMPPETEIENRTEVASRGERPPGNRLLPRSGRLTRRVKGLIAGLTLAFVVLAVWTYWPAATPVPAAVIARLEAVQGDVYQVSGATRTLVQSGEEIRAGQGLETGDDSTAVLAFADGTRLQLGADTVLAELSDGGKQVDLVEGSILAEVTRQASGRPMRMTTPRAELRSQGTKFLVSSGPNATHLELEKGLVTLVRRDDQQAVDVEAGFYAVVASDGVPLRSRPMSPKGRTPRLSLQGRFISLAFSPDGQTLATGTNGQVDLWDPKDGGQRASHRWNAEWVHALAFSPDSATLAMGGKSSRGIRLWKVGTPQFTQMGGGGLIHRLVFSPDGQTLAVSRAQTSFQIWDAVKHQERFTLSGHAGEVVGLAFGPTNKGLISASADGAIKLWDVERGLELATVAVGTGVEKPRKAVRLLTVAFSPDGSTVAAGYYNGTIQLWNLADRSLRASLRQHAGPITSLAFAPDGKLLASGSRDRSVKLWDPATAAEEVSLLGHEDAILDVAFSPDGKTLASLGKDQKVNLWNVADATSR